MVSPIPNRAVRLRALIPLVLAAWVCTPWEAHARSRGVSSVGCEGCHASRENSSVAISPVSVVPGQETTLVLTLSDPDAAVAGVHIELEDTSGFRIPGGTPLAVVDSGITHTAPRAFSGGEARFEIIWQVPSTPGATRFVVSALAGNGDGRSGGDEAFVENIDIVYGCEPATYYRDFDLDGYGRPTFPLVHCAGGAPPGYSSFDTDCDDNSEAVFPTADEYCNRRDDDCDGEIDEGAIPVELYPDADGDGYFSNDERLSGDVVMGCVPYPGYADLPGDCEPENPEANPGAEEVCDLYTDDNCNGRVDERVRPICGVGWCRRESITCDIEDCTPGSPNEEVCNFMDDDCDDEVDEGDLCPAGQECAAGACRDIVSSSSAGSSVSTSPNAAGSSGEGLGCSVSFARGSSRTNWPLLAILASAWWGARRRRRKVRTWEPC